MRVLMRLTGYVLAAAGFFILILDGLKSIAAGTFYFSRIADTWQAMHVSSLQALQVSLEKLSPFLWDPIVLTLLLTPSCLILLGLGGLALSLGRSHEGVTIGSPARR